MKVTRATKGTRATRASSDRFVAGILGSFSVRASFLLGSAIGYLRDACVHDFMARPGRLDVLVVAAFGASQQDRPGLSRVMWCGTVGHCEEALAAQLQVHRSALNSEYIARCALHWRRHELLHAADVIYQSSV